MKANMNYRTLRGLRYSDFSYNRFIEKKKREVQVGDIVIVRTVGFNTYHQAPPRRFRGRVLSKYPRVALVEFLENGVRECFTYDQIRVEERK